MSDRKDLPPATAANFLPRLREEMAIMMGNRGEPLDQTVRFKDLYDSSLLRLDPDFLAGNPGKRPIISGPGPAAPPVYVVDLTPPPTPTGFTALAAISNLLLQHDPALFTAGHGYLRTVLYGASRTSLATPAPTFANSVELTQFVGTVAAYPTNPSTIWHLWIKWVSVDGVLSESPAGGINGVSVTTAVDVTRLVAALTGPGNPFKVVTTSYTLADGTVVPVGTYTSDAYMGSFVAVRGQIGLLAVDDARIASLSVAKLKAGSISVGEFINSSSYVPGSEGWSINGNGQAEFSDVLVRGTIYALAGQIGGNTIDYTGVYSPSYSAGVSGWKLFPNGKAEFSAASIRGQLTSLQISARSITTDKIVVGDISAAQANNLVNYDAYPAAGTSFFDYTVRLINITTTGVPIFIWATVQVLTESNDANIDHFHVDVSVSIDGGPASTPALNVVSTELFTETTTPGRRQGEGSMSLAFRVPLSAGSHTLSIRHTIEPRKTDQTPTTFGSSGLVTLSSNLMCLENKV